METQEGTSGVMPPISKTPVSLLQELCMRRGHSPRYDLLQIEGEVHEPTFVYSVTVGEFVANGTGQSKKKAKHAAAKAALDTIIQGGAAGARVTSEETGPKEISEVQILPPNADSIKGNPVGSLLELCATSGWLAPTYDLISEQGFPHDRTFFLSCTVGTIKEIGGGKSKKLAKRQAAYKMEKRLQDSPPEQLPVDESISLDALNLNEKRSPVLGCKDAEITPLKNLKDLLDWSPNENAKIPVNELAQRSFSDNHAMQPKTLVCHDMKGGYLDDRLINGNSNSCGYRFYHWSGIDTFVYFSHHLVTIPPTTWISAAHTHGVQVLGTFITEWEPGATICEQILENDEILNQVVQNLVKIAQHYKFEGWLINIENEIKPDQIDQLVKFSKKLTDAMHEISPNSLVLWYDSVTKEGKLVWQNELNDLNKCYFNVCDGIFLNYTWTEEHLQRSKLAAGKRIADVYVGLDVFGRNFYKGGGFNTHLALEVARKHDLSAAIFAQGWTFETKDYDDFFPTEKKLWASLSPFLKYHGPVDLPFMTSFCQGFGEKVFNKGEVCNSGSWQHLGKMQHQPLWSQEDEAAELCLDTNASYNGGGCLKLTTSKPTSIRLFVCEFAWMISLLVSLTFRIQDTENIKDFYLVLHLYPKKAKENKIKDNKIIKLKCTNENGNKSTAENDIRDSNLYIIKPTVNISEGEWRSLTFDVADVEGFYCGEITVEVAEPLTILFGQLDMRNKCIKGLHTKS